MNDRPLYCPTDDEIAKKAMALRKKFSNRFVPMSVYNDALERISTLEEKLKKWQDAYGAMEDK